MEAMREAWTDERLDDLNEKVDKGFARVDARFDSMQSHIDKRFDSFEGRFAALQRTLLLTNGAIIAALIGVIATQV